jgi:branched-chain amino acid transport system permease protein
VPVLVGLPVAIVLAGLAGYLISRPILHLRGDYLAIVTIAFGEIVRMLLVNNVGGITGGSNGLSGIDQPTLFGFTFRTNLSHYYLVLFFVATMIVAVMRLQDSRLGRAWMYVREDQLAAEAMGVDTVHVKAVAFLLGSAGAGLAGALYASRISVISPDLSRFLESVIMFCIVVLGGVGSIPGVFVGTLGMVVLPELFRVVRDWRDLFVGLAMVLMMIFRPTGLWPSRRVAMEMEAEQQELAGVETA